MDFVFKSRRQFHILLDRITSFDTFNRIRPKINFSKHNRTKNEKEKSPACISIKKKNFLTID